MFFMVSGRFSWLSRYFHAFVFSTLSLSTVCNDKPKNVTCQQLTILFRLPGCFNVNSTLAFSILSLPIVNDKKNQFRLSQYSGSHDASMSTVLLLFPYFDFLSLTIKKINSDCLNVQALMMLQCQQCSCFFPYFYLLSFTRIENQF